MTIISLAGLLPWYRYERVRGCAIPSNQGLRSASPASREHGSSTFRRFLRYAAET
jgi:hypothetical protein